MSKINNILCTGTMRCGGSLVANLISTNKDIIVLTDIIHFFRYIFKKYDPIKKKENVFRICRDLELRLKYRDNIRLNSLKIYNECLKSSNISYAKIYQIIFNHFLKKTNKKKIAEYANFEWHNIDNFLKFNKNNVAVHVIRDPRAVLSSWKKRTFSKGYKYLNCIFNWINSASTYEKLRKKYDKKRYLLIKFEDIHRNPEKQTKILCSFLKINFQKRMLLTSKWSQILRSKYNFINQSAHEKKEKIYGFSTKRIDNWKNNLETWEINLINYLCDKYLVKLGYKSEKTLDKKLLKHAFSILNRDKFLKKKLREFKKNKIGNHLMLNDPTNPRNWESKIFPGKKFINTKEFYHFKKEEKSLNKIFSETNNEKKNRSRSI